MSLGIIPRSNIGRLEGRVFSLLFLYYSTLNFSPSHRIEISNHCQSIDDSIRVLLIVITKAHLAIKQPQEGH